MPLKIRLINISGFDVKLCIGTVQLTSKNVSICPQTNHMPNIIIVGKIIFPIDILLQKGVFLLPLKNTKKESTTKEAKPKFSQTEISQRPQHGHLVETYLREKVSSLAEFLM